MYLLSQGQMVDDLLGIVRVENTTGDNLFQAIKSMYEKQKQNHQMTDRQNKKTCEPSIQ